MRILDRRVAAAVWELAAEVLFQFQAHSAARAAAPPEKAAEVPFQAHSAARAADAASLAPAAVAALGSSSTPVMYEYTIICFIFLFLNGPWSDFTFVFPRTLGTPTY